MKTLTVSQYDQKLADAREELFFRGTDYHAKCMMYGNDYIDQKYLEFFYEQNTLVKDSGRVGDMEFMNEEFLNVEPCDVEYFYFCQHYLMWWPLKNCYYPNPDHYDMARITRQNRPDVWTFAPNVHQSESCTDEDIYMDYLEKLLVA